MLPRAFLMLLLAAASATASTATATAANPTADQVMTQARDAQRNGATIQQVRMVLVSKGGAERVRELELRVRRDGEVISSYTRFLSPSDVAGTQMVQVDHPDQVDEQLLYLPALKRTTRIAGSSRKGAFMGSDFSYEDLELSGASGGTHTLVEERADAWIIDSQPGADSSYSRVRSTVSKVDSIPRTVEFFDRGGKAVKTLDVLEVKQQGSTTIPVKSVMRDLSRGTSTRLEVVDLKVDVSLTELPAETFTAAYMERQL
jgi:Outer membrane lipoprotein-sorting protein